MRTPSSFAVALLFASAACSSPSKEPELAPPAARTPAAPWTRAFMEDAVLSAQEVRIEGPVGLLGHVVVVQDSENHDYEVRTVPEGLLIRATLRSDGTLRAIRAQLDGLLIDADHALTVLERPGEVPVTVEARGDVFHSVIGSDKEQRVPTLRLVGERPR